MIRVTRLNGAPYYLNPELIQSLEATPDTVITLLNNAKVVVRETEQVVVERILNYRRMIHNPEMKLPLGE